MIRATDLANSFEEIIGWLYISPGTNDQNGIDCSGAFVRGYRKHGRNIAHGSNTIFRKHCSATGRIDGDASRLHVGMAVFKCKPWTPDQSSNKWYMQEPGNIYHVGLVTSIGPLRIVHATEPVAKVDTMLSNWTHYGWLDEVSYDTSNYSDMAPEMSEDEYLQKPMVDVEHKKTISATVFSDNGKPVKLRSAPSLDSELYWDREVGTVLDVLEKGDEWCKVQSRSRIGYMMTKFLVFD